jgi:predicted acyl esterase
VVRSSIAQLLISDAAPGTTMAVRNAAGDVLQTGIVDAQGTLIFRDLPPGEGYVVFVVDGGPEQEAHPAAVWSMQQAPANDFYTAQRVGAGYQYITTRDGTKIAINVYLPGPAEDGPYPTVVEYSGYDPANPEAAQPGTLIASALGYAAVGINMRGTGCSGGSFKFFEPAQVTDGYDAIEIIAQQPWVKFNKVGMVGLSYPGISQLFVAQLQPPHLAAIAPLSVISDTARGILYPGGILNNGFATEWAIERQEQAAPFGQPWAAKRRDQGDQVCIENQRFRGQNPDLVDLIRANRYYYPEVADPLAPFTFVDKINVPVFLAGAWQDEQTGGYFPNMLDRFTRTDKLHFTMTNGGHTDALGPAVFSRWTEFLSFYVRREIPAFPGIARLAVSVIGQQIFGVDRLRVEPDRFTDETSFAAALARFEAEPRVRILFENGHHPSWPPGAPVAHFEHSFPQWPPPGLVPTAWYLGAGGRLSADPPGTAGSDSYQYDTSRSQLTTIVGGDDTIWKALPNWNWRQPAAGKAAVYESETLQETLVMLGSGSVDLWLESTSDDTDIQVTLSEVRPDGKETYVQSGWLRASHRALDAEATMLRPVHTHREDDAAPLPAGVATEVRIEIFPFAHVFRAGSRLRLIIDTPGGTRPRWRFDVLKPAGPVINTIHRSPVMPSRVVLPVLPGIDAPAELPRCPSLRLQYCRSYQPYSNGD